MTGNMSHLPNSDVAIRALHAEIEKLASTASTAYLSKTPLRISDNGIGDEMTFWYDGELIKVFTCDGSVFMSGIEHFGYWPDWFCLDRQEARAIAQGLLSAAAYISRGDDS
ncbi:hypothetical protein SEA_LATRETIUM_73 [Mycobacterium phage Latretium]|nr:hypothetical protein SEA_LATRETIUM_73 [Mycobacterium phage Latretium]